MIWVILFSLIKVFLLRVSLKEENFYSMIIEINKVKTKLFPFMQTNLILLISNKNHSNKVIMTARKCNHKPKKWKQKITKCIKLRKKKYRATQCLKAWCTTICKTIWIIKRTETRWLWAKFEFQVHKRMADTTSLNKMHLVKKDHSI